MIKQVVISEPKDFIIKNGIRYKFIKKCNDMLFLYQNEKYGWKTTFSNYDLGMVEEADEKPFRKPFRLKF